MADRTALVTGSHGFAGAWLCSALLEDGWEVVGLDRSAASSRPMALGLLGLTDDVRPVQMDLLDREGVERALVEASPDVVFHLAAQTQVGEANASPLPTFEVNVVGTWNLLEGVRSLEATPRVVVASSDKAYGAQEDLPYREDAPLLASYPYDASKAAADLIARSYWHTYGIPVAVTRFANLYGGGDLHGARLIPETVRAVLEGRRPVLRSDGSPERDYLQVEDAARAYLSVAAALEGEGIAGEAFNAGSGRPWSVLEVVEMICQLAGSDLKPEIAGEGTPPGEIDRQFLDSTKILESCGWKPALDLETGLERTLAWYSDHPEAVTAIREPGSA